MTEFSFWGELAFNDVVSALCARLSYCWTCILPCYLIISSKRTGLLLL